jgi:2-polyprenyl-6-methoxyphenol hydroxylase-like FAD-dependent oxidoreductase
VRKQVGISLERQDPMNYVAGLLIEGLEDVPDDHDVNASEGDMFFVMFHQGRGRARAYLVPGLSGQHRFAGPSGTANFLAACKIDCYPWSAAVASGTPAGPCATYPGDDTWTDTPYAEGVVLIGDAAGHNDPIIGQGLSIALRDARVVRDLILDGARQPSDFRHYGQERMTRMERLRFAADVLSVSQCEDAENRRARRAFLGEKLATMDSEYFPIVLGMFIGPESIPQELLRPELLERIRDT